MQQYRVTGTKNGKRIKASDGKYLPVTKYIAFVFFCRAKSATEALEHAKLHAVQRYDDIRAEPVEFGE